MPRGVKKAKVVKKKATRNEKPSATDQVMAALVSAPQLRLVKRHMKVDARSNVLNNVCSMLSESVENICAAVVQADAIADENNIE